MVYAEPYVYVRALGVFGDTSTPRETWGVGFKFRHPDTPPTPAQIQAFIETCSPVLSAFHAGPISAGTTCFLTEITGALIGTDGKYVGGSTQVTRRHLLGTPTAGTGTDTFPWSQALVLSLRTALSRGAGSNGRVYWPMCGQGISGSTGGLAAGTRNGILAAAVTLVNDLNAAKESAMPGTGKLAVMSNVGTGIAATVTAVRVGVKPDRQERRERDVAEAYAQSSVAAAAAAGIALDGIPIGTVVQVP